MHLHVHILAVLLDPLEGVSGVAVHAVVAIGSTTVREQDHDLVDGLGVLREVVLEFGKSDRGIDIR